MREGEGVNVEGGRESIVRIECWKERMPLPFYHPMFEVLVGLLRHPEWS